MNLGKCLVFSDCSLAVFMLNRPPELGSELALLLAEIQAPSRVEKIEFKPRSTNVVAHLIAKLALGSKSEVYCVGDVTVCAFETHCRDIMSLL